MIPRIDEALAVLHRDEHYVAVYKPAGLLVHRSQVDRRETRFALQQVRDQLGCRVFPVHRLDKPTAGVLLFALSSEAASRVGPDFEAGGDGAVRKRYRAVVRGWVDAEGVIDHPLADVRDRHVAGPRDSGPPVPDPPAPVRKPAVTRYRCLSLFERDEPVGRYPTARHSLLELSIEHGRRHQIRRHLKHVFHPVVGDTTYGDGKHNALLRRWTGRDRLLLVATELEFRQPFTNELVRIATDPDEGFLEAVAALGASAASPA